jgi:hypothetical protein
MGSLSEFAKDELERAGLFDKSGDFYGGLTGKAVMELIEVFEKQNHSGVSARIVISLFSRLAKYQTITQIEDEEDEWIQVTNDVYQHKRCSGLFKEGGKYYYIHAIVWKEIETGATFTGTVDGISSKQEVKLPFIPKTFYVQVVKDENGEDKIYDKETLNKAFEYFSKEHH